jgi:hypothetical protein
MSREPATPQSGELRRQVRCPTCRKPAAYEGNPWRPFCSERCKLIDLGNWAEGRYALPGEAPPDTDGEEEP